MKNVEKEIKNKSSQLIESALPSIESLDKIPLKNKKANKLPFILIPLGVVALVVAIVLPIALQPKKETVPKSFNYVANDEITSFLESYMKETNQSEMPAPAITFNYAMQNRVQMALVEYDFNYKNSTGKIAVTMSKKSLDELHINTSDKWKTIESDIIDTANRSCEVSLETRNDLQCVRFEKGEKVPCIIDGRYVVALYYECESFLVEEITSGIVGKNKKIDYCSVSAVEGDKGYLKENIPGPYSIKRFYYGYGDLITDDGYFALSLSKEYSVRKGVLEGETLILNDNSFFYNVVDKLGKITPLIQGNSINYEEFKRVIPDYIAYYQSEEFTSKKNIPFVEHINEFADENKSLGHVVYLYEDYPHLENYISKKPFIAEFVDKYDESFFVDHDIIIASDFHSAARYYELKFDSIILQSGFFTVTMKKEYTEGKRGSTFSIAELSKSDLATLESTYISYSVIE